MLIFPWCPCELTTSFKSTSTDTSHPLSKATVRMRPLSFDSLHVNHQILLLSHANDRLLMFTVCQYYSVKAPMTEYQHINSSRVGLPSIHYIYVYPFILCRVHPGLIVSLWGWDSSKNDIYKGFIVNQNI